MHEVRRSPAVTKATVWREGRMIGWQGGVLHRVFAAEHLRQVAVVADGERLATSESAQILTKESVKHVDVVLSRKAVRVQLGR